MLHRLLKNPSLCTLARALIFVCGVATLAVAQSSTRADLPGVDVPSPMSESDPFPAMEEVVPPSVSDDAYPSPVDPYVVDDTPMMHLGDVDTSPAYTGEFANDDCGPDYFGDGTGCDLDYPAGSVCEDCGPAPIYSTGTWYKRGRFFIDGEYVFFTREHPRDLGLIDEGASGDQLPGLRNFDYGTNDLHDHRYQSGLRISGGAFLGRDAMGRDHLVEAKFFGAFSWEDFSRIDALVDNSLNTVLEIGAGPEFAGFIANDAQTFVYDTDYNSVEVNYRLRARPGRDVLALQPNGAWVRHGIDSAVRSFYAGLQGGSFNEGIAYRGLNNGIAFQTLQTSNDEDGTVTNSVDSQVMDDFENGRYAVLVNNDLFGMHVGGEHIVKHDEWSWGIRGKVGGLANFVNRRSTLASTRLVDNEQIVRQAQRTNDNGELLFLDANNMETTTDTGTPAMETDTLITRTVAFDSLTPSSLNDEELAITAEIGLFTTYQLRPNLHFRAGYDFLLLQGVALAPENMLLQNGFPLINANGTVVLHGGSVGFETTW